MIMISDCILFLSECEAEGPVAATKVPIKRGMTANSLETPVSSFLTNVSFSF